LISILNQNDNSKRDFIFDSTGIIKNKIEKLVLLLREKDLSNEDLENSLNYYV
jgi:hypothetical protein